MGDGIARRFIDALGRLERRRELEPMVGLFADDAGVGNVLVTEGETGPSGTREFWARYRGSFDALRSEFRNVIEADGRAALEWTTTGDANGKEVFYDGVSLLEIEDGKVSRFRAYFDPSDLGEQVTDAVG